MFWARIFEREKKNQGRSFFRARRGCRKNNQMIKIITIDHVTSEYLKYTRILVPRKYYYGEGQFVTSW